MACWPPGDHGHRPRNREAPYHRPATVRLNVQPQYLVDRFGGGSIRLWCPDVADVSAGRETVRGAASAGGVVGRRDVRAVRAQLSMAVGVEARDRGLRDRAVRSPDLAVCPWISAWSAGGRCRRPRGSCRGGRMVFRCRGRSATGLPLSVRDPTGHRLGHAVFLSAVATRGATANLAVRSMPANRSGLPPAVCTSAIPMPLTWRSGWACIG